MQCAHMCVMDGTGRKKFQLVNNILFLSGATLEALSSGVWMMSAGRLLIGLGCGGVSVVVPLYLGEIAPPNLRGALGMAFAFASAFAPLPLH
jgi:MFS family permease